MNDQHRAGVLEQLAQLPLRRWSYRLDPQGTRHLGPTAQDFATAFGTPDRGGRIGLDDALGLAEAALLEISHRLDRRRAQIAAARRELGRLQS